MSSISDCNWTQTQNHLVRKQTLNHLAKLAKYQSSIFAVQGTELHNLVLLHTPYSSITNSLLGLLSLAKCMRL